MDALKYENLIRRAHGCGRMDVPGANADYYRGLQTRYIRYRDNTDPDRNVELLTEYAFACGEIAAYVYSAISKFQNDYEDQFNDDQREELNELTDLLIDANIDELDQVIERAEVLMLLFGLNPL